MRHFFYLRDPLNLIVIAALRRLMHDRPEKCWVRKLARAARALRSGASQPKRVRQRHVDQLLVPAVKRDLVLSVNPSVVLSQLILTAIYIITLLLHYVVRRARYRIQLAGLA